MTNQARHPKGVPAGGQFASTGRAESDAVSLDATVVVHPAAFARPLTYGEPEPSDLTDPFYTEKKICPACHGSGAVRDYARGAYSEEDTCVACCGEGELTGSDLNEALDQYAAARDEIANIHWAYGEEVLAGYDEQRMAEYESATDVDDRWTIPVAWPGTVVPGEPPF